MKSSQDRAILSPPPLPIEDSLPAILASLRQTPNLVVIAEAGSGKTTRIPPALLALGEEVLVLEPRRIAARLAARRVASERGEPLGQSVGLQVRFEEISSPATRLRFLTKGVLTRRLLSDPELAGIATVVLDEFHERHLETDLALALLRRLQHTKRPDLRIVILSATLDPEPVARFLGDAPVLRSAGRTFPIEITHLPYSPAPPADQVASAAAQILEAQPGGDILVFLPGAAEIRNAAVKCQPLAARHNLEIAPLFGDLTPAEQDRAVTPGQRPKVILSTNIAESSITIEGITAVIDSGLARIARDNPWTGLPGLELRRVSKASAAQRAGRAGRTAPGRVLRLYTAEDFHRRPDHDAPEILRRELSQLCLQLRAMGIAHPDELAWLDAPPANAVVNAEQLLHRLDATDALARIPVHPRLAKLIVEGIRLGVGEEACRAAALLSSGDRPRSPELLHALDEEQSPRTRQIFEQLRRITRPPRDKSVSDDALSTAVLLAFPDRAARRRASEQFQLVGGATAALRSSSEFIVAIDVEERSDKPIPLIRLACPIQPDWLLELFFDRISERTTAEWNRVAERVEISKAILYEDLPIDETRSTATGSPEAAQLLADKVFETGLDRFVDIAALNEFLARVELAAGHSRDSIHPIGPDELKQSLLDLISGLYSFAQVREAAPQLIASLEARVNRRLLDEIAPSKLRLPSGRTAKVHYETGKPPWVASRLQDFFGMRESPRVARGEVPLLVHLLAPNQRPVQMTTDLPGFWERLYPRLRRELGRRYPKHAWPEDPYRPTAA